MKYKIHEVAALFPLMPKGSKPYNDLEEHIRLFGQLEPIVVDGDTLLDGRNRLAICEDNGIKPKVVEWSTLAIKNPQDEWIFGKNAARRNLTEEQRAAIYTAYNAWTQLDMARQKKERAQFKPGACPNPAGRAGKQVNLKSGSPVRDVNTMHANSTAGKVAAASGVSRYKAEQIVALAKRAGAGDAEAQADFTAIKEGLKTVRQIIKTPKKVKPKPSLEQRCERAWKRFWNQFEAEEKTKVRKWLNDQL